MIPFFFFFFSNKCSLDQYHLSRNPFLSSLQCHLCLKASSHVAYGLFLSSFCSIVLVSLYLNYCTFITSLKKWQHISSNMVLL